MKANFALALSFNEIRLLHRAAGGWRPVGEVEVSAPDLDRDLSHLRKTALELEPAGLATKVILPPEQIKYLTLDTGDVSKKARRKAARAALEGATPYEVRDLAFDICADGAQTHVAAVARETLQEAEDFATTHGFAPLSFVAIPGEAAFLGEPFFGASKFSAGFLSEGGEVEPDGIAVVVLDAAAETTPEPEPIAAPEEVLADAPEPVAEVFDKRTAETDAHAADAIATSPTIADPAPQPSSPPLSARAEPDLDGPAQKLLVGFSSRRTGDVLGGASRTAVPKAPPKTPPPPPAPVASHPSALDRTPVSVPKPTRPVAKTPADPVVPKHPGFGGAPKMPKEVKPFAAPTSEVPKPESEQARMTVFGARSEPEVGGKPRFLGLILTALLLLFMAGVAAWAALFLDDGVAGLFRPGAEPAPTQQAAVPAPAAKATETEATVPIPRKLAANPAPDAPAQTAPEAAPNTAAPAPEEGTIRTASLSPLQTPSPQLRAAPQLPVPAAVAASPQIYHVVSGIWSDSPGAPVATAPGNTEGIVLASIDPNDRLRPGALVPALDHGDRVIATPDIPHPAGVRFRFDDRGLVYPSPEGTETPDGIRVFSGPPPAVPRDLPEGRRTPPQTALSALAAIRPPQRPGAARDPQPAPAAPVASAPVEPQNVNPELSRFRPPAQRPNAPVDDAALPAAPEPHSTLAGIRPPAAERTAEPTTVTPAVEPVPSPANPALAAIRPPAAERPAVPAAAAPAPEPELTPAARALAAIRPPSRQPDVQIAPAPLARSNPNPALAAMRPPSRPQLSVPAAPVIAAPTAAQRALAAIRPPSRRPRFAVAAPAPVITPAAPTPPAATALTPRQQALAAVRPQARPRNFARVVKRANRAEPETRAVAQVKPATVKPIAPTTRSVARQATVKDQLNLRKINLIGVSGKPNNRRALVRLANGRFRKVGVGDRIDGGRVSSIGVSDLRYSKGGRNIVLKMPRT